MSSNNDIAFLQWALPRLGYRWEGFRKPREQVLKRIRLRMHELGLPGGFPEYKQYLQEHPEEWAHLDTLCDVTISKFFRDRGVWEYLRDKVLPEIAAKKEGAISIWSVGCCNGEEPYSLSIIAEQFQDQSGTDITIEILATDRNPEVLQRARAGRYPAGALLELSEEEISRFFVEIESEDDNFQIKDTIKQRVQFEHRDIKCSLPDRRFDLVLCRNLVFTYFTQERQCQFLENIKPRFAGGGYLVVGSNEQVPDVEGLATFSKTHRVYRVMG